MHPRDALSRADFIRRSDLNKHDAYSAPRDRVYPRALARAASLAPPPRCAVAGASSFILLHRVYPHGRRIIISSGGGEEGREGEREGGSSFARYLRVGRKSGVAARCVRREIYSPRPIRANPTVDAHIGRRLYV